MKAYLIFGLAAGVFLFTATALSNESNTNSPLGINLAGISYWSSELVFVDLFKQSSSWISQAEGKKWGQGEKLDLTDDGWVKSLRPGQRAESLLCIMNGHYPGGNYVCHYDGQGEFELKFDAQIVERAEGKIKITAKPSNGGILVSIMQTNPDDPIRNIRIIPENCPVSAEEKPFRADFLKRWEKFKVIRFMDWMSTNNSKIAKWQDRPTTNMQTQGQKGVALEYMIELANTLNADPWFCMPHLVTDDYIRNFAKTIQSQLKPNLKVYIEYTNEAWNGQFEQARYCAKEGRRLKLSDNDYQAQLFYYSKRSVEIFKIWQEVFGSDKRLIRVLACQSANPWTGLQVMEFEEAYKHADALAVAPYFGHSLGSPDKQDETAAMSMEQVFEECEKAIEKNRSTTKQNADNAKKYSLDLISYEGGQHLVGHGGAENNKALEELLQSVNRHPRMKELYLEDLNNWKNAGGKMFAVFSSTGVYSKWGSWGLLEYSDQDIASAPKYQAVLEFIEKNPVWW